jgi:iron complex transport system ATP-binding protein
MELMPIVSAEALSFSYGGRDVLREVTLEVRRGEVLALLGPNGSGKTTLLKLLLGLLRPSAGVVRLRGRDMRRVARRDLARELAYVPQVHRAAFAYTVLDVVLMGRMPHATFTARYGETDRRIAREALEKLGAGGLAERPYTEVSGGERQLALIARAMAQGARVLVMDEPTSALDYGNQLRLLERMALLARQGLGFVFSTHHPDHALAVADRVVMITRGAVLHEGPPGEVVTAASLRELYGVEVRVVALPDTAGVCVPGLRLEEDHERRRVARRAEGLA